MANNESGNINFEFLTGLRKNSVVMYLPDDKQMFIKKYSYNTRDRYTCYKRECNASLVFDRELNKIIKKSDTFHLHPEQENVMKKMKLINEIKIDCSSGRLKREQTPRDIFDEKCLKMQDAAHLVNYKSIKRTLNKIKNSLLPKSVEMLSEIKEIKQENTSDVSAFNVLPPCDSRFLIGQEKEHMPGSKSPILHPTAEEFLPNIEVFVKEEEQFQDTHLPSKICLTQDNRSFQLAEEKSLAQRSNIELEEKPVKENKRSEDNETVLQEALYCMRTFLEVNSSSDEHFTYGEYIAERLRNCNRDKSEINVAKKLIENVAFNLSMGHFKYMGFGGPKGVNSEQQSVIYPD